VTGVSGGSERETDAVPYRVLSLRAIVWTAAVIVGVGVAVAIWLLLAYGGDGDTNRNRLDAIRTAGTIVVGTGGGVALLLAARRQRSTEIALKHGERVAADARQDAAERRITDLYTKAVEQLGSDKAAVRLGGLYALERLAQNVSEQRQTIVNVICAYLRMSGESSDQEHQVRHTAQRILTLHLRPGPDPDHPAGSFWSNIDLDLTGALLTEFNLSRCRLRTGRFTCAQFKTYARFDDAVFTSNARFIEASFEGNAHFQRAQFHGDAHFTGTEFTGPTNFTDTQFTQRVLLDQATFARGIPNQLAPPS
jgi:hypothetical protein